MANNNSLNVETKAQKNVGLLPYMDCLRSSTTYLPYTWNKAHADTQREHLLYSLGRLIESVEVPSYPKIKTNAFLLICLGSYRFIP